MKCFIFGVILATVLCEMNAENMEINESYNSREEKPIKVVHHRQGEDVYLKCKDHEKRGRFFAHKWKFAQCHKCDLRSTDLKWRDLHESYRLHLRNVTTSDSGRYICTIYDEIVAIYQLEIASQYGHVHHLDLRVNKPLKFRGRPPAILHVETPPPDEIHPENNIAVKCRVSSPIVPRIWWLKECTSSAGCALKYDNKFYRKLNDTHQDILQHIEDNIFVSKLHLNNFTREDDGVYVCLTMTELGKDVRNFSLYASTPRPLPDETVDEMVVSLNFLFLIPFLFILVLICIDCIVKRLNQGKQLKQSNCVL